MKKSYLIFISERNKASISFTVHSSLLEKFDVKKIQHPGISSEATFTTE